MKVGSLASLVEMFERAYSNTTLLDNMLPLESRSPTAACGAPGDRAFHLFRPADDKGLPWSGVLFGLTISATW